MGMNYVKRQETLHSSPKYRAKIWLNKGSAHRCLLASHTLEAPLHAEKKNNFYVNNCRWSSLLAIWLPNFSWLTWRVYYWKRSVEKLVYKGSSLLSQRVEPSKSTNQNQALSPNPFRSATMNHYIYWALSRASCSVLPLISKNSRSFQITTSKFYFGLPLPLVLPSSVTISLLLVTAVTDLR